MKHFSKDRSFRRFAIAAGVTAAVLLMGIMVFDPTPAAAGWSNPCYPGFCF
ncbi:MAG: hypothetical protein AAF615_09495 [Pseudomonadota bacterium]